MSKLSQHAAKAGLVFPVKKTNKKTSMEEVTTPKNIAEVVDKFLVSSSKLEEVKAEVAENAATLREFSLDRAVKNKSMQNQILTGDEGAVNVVFKDQYSLDAEHKEQLDAFLKGKGLGPERFVTENTSVVFNFDLMTDKEKDALFKYITDTLGEERFKLLVQDKVTYTVKGLNDQMPVIAKDREEFDHLRSISGHYSPQVAPRKEKIKL